MALGPYAATLNPVFARWVAVPHEQSVQSKCKALGPKIWQQQVGALPVPTLQSRQAGRRCLTHG